MALAIGFGIGRAESLTVLVYNYAAVPAGVLSNAEKETVRILRSGGIDLSLVPCPVSEADYRKTPSRFAACIKASGAPIVRIESQPSALRGSIGGAAKDERVAISYDRVQRVCAVDDITPAKLLGHIMAHELGHVLLGDDSHSPDGIMIKTFRAQEIHRAQTGTLLFSARQAAQMRAGLRARGPRSKLSP